MWQKCLWDMDDESRRNTTSSTIVDLACWQSSVYRDQVIVTLQTMFDSTYYMITNTILKWLRDKSLSKELIDFVWAFRWARVGILL